MCPVQCVTYVSGRSPNKTKGVRFSLAGPLLHFGAERPCFVRVLFFVLLLFAGVASAQEHKTVVVPFQTVKGMILLDATVNGNPAVLLLDTGATYTVVSQQSAGLTTIQLRALQANQASTGSSGDAVQRKVDLRLAANAWPFREVFVMNLDATTKRMGTRIDGLLGQDVLREFSSVRIDFKNHTLELEQ